MKRHVLSATSRLQFEEGEVMLVEQGQLIALDAAHNGMHFTGYHQPPTDGCYMDMLPLGYVESDIRHSLVSIHLEMTYELCPVLPFFRGHFVAIDGGPNVYKRYRVITRNADVRHLAGTRVISETSWFDMFDPVTLFHHTSPSNVNVKDHIVALVRNNKPEIRIAYMVVRFYNNTTFSGRFFVPFNLTHGVLIANDRVEVVEYCYDDSSCEPEFSLSDACLARLG